MVPPPNRAATPPSSPQGQWCDSAQPRDLGRANGWAEARFLRQGHVPEEDQMVPMDLTNGRGPRGVIHPTG